jgi:hypothetical protein
LRAPVEVSLELVDENLLDPRSSSRGRGAKARFFVPIMRAGELL